MLKNFKYSGLLFYLLTGVFILLNGYFLFKGNYYFSALPIFLAIALFSFYNINKLLYFAILCTPISLNLESMDIGMDLGFYLPTEPILFGLSIILIMRFIKRGTYDKKILNHGLTITVLFYLSWLFITTLTSSNILVSFKFLISKLWFIIPLFLYATSLFKDLKNIYLVLWLYLSSLSIVVLITIIRHYQWGFDQEIAHWIMSPFFKDHTSYGAIVAFYIPITVGLLFRKNNTPLIQFTLFLILAILTTGLLYSYTRAAWLSLVGAIGVYMLFRFKIKFKYIAILGLIISGIGFNYYTDISIALNKNKTDSSENLSKHIESISNVSTDASNLERINRWNCAIKMFNERPIFGWGGGTYSFEYAPFQHSGDITVISTNFGNKGNAHSEYLGALAETGLIGGISFILIVILLIYRASMLYIELDDPDLKILVMSILLAVISYFIHGVLNNYLDTDKASVPIWTCAAMILALDIHHFKKQKTINK
jgi:putative inorganic carbon (HCO3(-)) transporter